METFFLSNGTILPAVGFGTYNADDTDNYEMIKKAIDAGYRYFDTASFYETERVLGKAIKDSGIERSEFIIESKLWIDEMGYEEAKAAFERSLERLQMDYLDIYIIHWPKQSEDVPEAEWKRLILETYRALEELYEEGKIKAIGLSNFLPHHLMCIIKNCKVLPVTNQLECHIGYTQQVAREFCQKYDILVQAWSPLGRKKLMSEPCIVQMAEKYKVSSAQLALRFLYQLNVLSFVKSASVERMKENMDIFGFEISDEDMYMLQCMPQTGWSTEHPDFSIPHRSSNFEQ